MAAERMGAVLAAMASVDGDDVTMIDRVCGATVKLLSVRGAGISLIVDGQPRGTAGVTERGVAAVLELHVTLGEGPCLDAWRLREPVLEVDLTEPAVARWPTFATAAAGEGVRSVFAFPLGMGAIGIGVLVACRDRPGGLSNQQLADGLLLAQTATQVILALQAGVHPEGVHELLAGDGAHWAEVHRATGMLAAQLGVPLDQAFVRLRAHAFVTGRRLGDVAGDVVARRLRLNGAT